MLFLMIMFVSSLLADGMQIGRAFTCPTPRLPLGKGVFFYRCRQPVLFHTAGGYLSVEVISPLLRPLISSRSVLSTSIWKAFLSKVLVST